MEVMVRLLFSKYVEPKKKGEHLFLPNIIKKRVFSHLLTTSFKISNHYILPLLFHIYSSLYDCYFRLDTSLGKWN